MTASGAVRTSCGAVPPEGFYYNAYPRYVAITLDHLTERAHGQAPAA